jgi:hypothetical protein
MSSPDNYTKPPNSEETCLQEPIREPSLHTTPGPFWSQLPPIDFSALEKNLNHLLAHPTCFDDFRNLRTHAAITFLMDNIITPSQGTRQITNLPDSMRDDVMSVLSRYGSEYALPGPRRVGSYSAEQRHPTLVWESSGEISELHLNDKGIPEVPGGFQTSDIGTSSDIADTKIFDDIRQNEKPDKNTESPAKSGESIEGEPQTEASISQTARKHGNYQPPTVETIQDEAFNKIMW